MKIEDYVFDRDGNPMSLADWNGLKLDSYRFVAVHEGHGYRVSTIWLGYDMNLAERPEDRAIFESMVRSPSGEYIHQERYATEAKARAGHARLVAQVGTIAGGMLAEKTEDQMKEQPEEQD